jgi:hypothetical protein
MRRRTKPLERLCVTWQGHYKYFTIAKYRDGIQVYVRRGCDLKFVLDHVREWSDAIFWRGI